MNVTLPIIHLIMLPDLINSVPTLQNGKQMLYTLSDNKNISTKEQKRMIEKTILSLSRVKKCTYAMVLLWIQWFKVFRMLIK